MAVKINNVIFKAGISKTSEKHTGFISGVKSWLPVAALYCVEKVAEFKNVLDCLM
jgi:hypothetical protein